MLPLCKRKPKIYLLATIALALLAGWQNEVWADQAESNFIHPGIAHTSQSIAFVKAKLQANEQPWKGAWERLHDSRYARLRPEPEPRAHVKRGAYGNPDIGASEFVHDASAAYTHALIWVLKDDQEHAVKAAEILTAWAETLRSIGEHDAALLTGMCGHHYCNAAELIKHTSDVWSKEDQREFARMLKKIWYPIIKDFYPTANGNWDASMLQTMLSMGVFLDDREMFDRAVNYYLEGSGNGAILNYFNDFGQCQETGRDQAHTQMGLEFLANSCEIAWNQGIDLYGAHNNRLLLGFEYTAQYNLGFDVKYEPFESYQGRYFYKSISEEARGRLRPMYEKVLNHYKNRKRLEAPFTEQAVMKTRPESRGRSILPWGTLMFAQQPAEFDGAKQGRSED